MSQQLIFNFPFKKTYLSQDFYVSKNNFNAFKLIESWPQWPSRFINIFGPKGCGKTHLANILSAKIRSLIISANKIDNSIIGGIILKVNSIMIDNSIKNKLVDYNLNERFS